jgi:hypothetical protein
MKLLIHGDRIAGTATDDYTGPMAFLPEPEDFDILRLGDYRLIDGQLVIPAPSVCTMRQARLALLGAGLLDAVEAAIAAMEGAEGKAAQIEWEYATEVRRDSHLVDGLTAALGLTDAQLNDLFTVAASL